MSLLRRFTIEGQGAFGFDAGSRTRVSQMTTLADLKTLGADEPLLWENTGTGTQTFGANKTTQAVTSGQYTIRRSRRYYPYMSGKSHLIELTQDRFDGEANVTKRLGYFSSNAVAPYDSNKDGFWLESTVTGVSLHLQRDGVALITPIPQSSWNVNQLPGIDWTNFQVVAFDFLWLGGAVLRLFVKTDAGFQLCHVVNFAGTLVDTFTRSPNHSVRYEMRSTTGSGTFRPICAHVSTEGSVEEAGKQFSVNTGATAISLATIGTKYPIIGVRKGAGFRDIPLKVTDFAGFVSSNTDVLLLTLEINPTLSAPLTYAAAPGSKFERAFGNGTIQVTAAGTIISTAYLSQNTLLPTGLLDDDFLSWLSSTIGDVSDEIILCGTPITATVGAHASIDVKQY